MSKLSTYIAQLPALRSKSVIKRMLLSLLIIAVISVLWWWSGAERSLLVSVLTGAGGVALADLLLSNKEIQRKRFDLAKCYLRENALEIVQGALWLSIGIGAYALRKIPTDPLVQQIGHLVEIFGLPFLVVFAFFRRAISPWEQSYLLVTFLKGIGAYTLALWAIGELGDFIIAFAKSNPDEAIAYVVALAIIREIVRSIDGLSVEPTMITRQAAGFVGRSVAVRRSPTERDNRYTAAHEAGHAMVYAALPVLPADLRLVVHAEPDNTHVLGFVTGINSDHYLQEKTFAEWYMLMFLAGKLGEVTLFGESTLGSSTDHTRWLNLAKSYLANHYRGPFYAEPATKLEQEQNDQLLNTLQQEQLTMLQSLFCMNREIFAELTDALLEKRTMLIDDIRPFLARMVLPEGFPRLHNVESTN